MKKLFILTTPILFLTSCFGGEEVDVEVPQVENIVQEEIITDSDNVIIESDIVEELDVLDEVEGNNTESVREVVPIEKVEIKETWTDNENYDIRANIETDPNSQVVTEETFVIPTAPRAEEIQVEEVELSAENENLADEVLSELLEGIVELEGVIEENE